MPDMLIRPHVLPPAPFVSSNGSSITCFSVRAVARAPQSPKLLTRPEAQVLDDVVEHLPESFDLEAIRARVDEPSPYAMVAIQARRA